MASIRKCNTFVDGNYFYEEVPRFDDFGPDVKDRSDVFEDRNEEERDECGKSDEESDEYSEEESDEESQTLDVFAGELNFEQAIEEIQTEYLKITTELEDLSKIMSDVKNSREENQESISDSSTEINQWDAEREEEPWVKKREVTSVVERHRREVSGLKEQIVMLKEALKQSEKRNKTLENHLENQNESEDRNNASPKRKIEEVEKPTMREKKKNPSIVLPHQHNEIRIKLEK